MTILKKAIMSNGSILLIVAGFSYRWKINYMQLSALVDKYKIISKKIYKSKRVFDLSSDMHDPGIQCSVR
jgi:hypothetical protein